MKNFFVFLSIAALFAFTACDDKKPADEQPPQDTGTITIDQSQLNRTVDAKATSIEIDFSTDGAWDAAFESDASWMTFDPKHGEKGAHTIIADILANTTTSERSAIIVITSGDSTAKVTITQDAGEEGGGEDDEYIITATGIIENVSAEDVVKAAAMINPLDMSGDEQGTVIASVDYANNTFTLKLGTPDAKLLNDEFANAPEGITVSDPTAKSAQIRIVGLDADDEVVDWFLYMSDDGEYYGQYMYVDKDVNIVGEYDDDGYLMQYDLQLKKGWNMLYYWEGYDENTDTLVDGYTTARPAGAANLKWAFGFPE